MLLCGYATNFLISEKVLAAIFYNLIFLAKKADLTKLDSLLFLSYLSVLEYEQGSNSQC